MYNKTITIGEACTLVNGYAFKPSDWKDEGLPIIRIQNLNDPSAPFNYFDGVIPEKYFVHSGDLLFSWSGTPGSSFGAFIWDRGEGVLNQHIFNVYPSEGINKRFFLYALNGRLQEMIDKAHGGVGLQHITKKELESIEVYIPDPARQAEIVRILDMVSSIIKDRKDQLTFLDKLVKSRFIEMFGGIDPSDYRTIAEICSIITDGTHQPPKFVSEGIPFLFVSNITGNVLTYKAEKFIDEQTYSELIKRTPIEIGDILLSTVGSYGHPAVVKEPTRFCFQRHIAYLKPKASVVDSDYLHGAILSSIVQAQIEEKVKGIAQKTLNLSEIRTIRVPVPEIHMQRAFAHFAAETDKSKYSAEMEVAA